MVTETESESESVTESDPVTETESVAETETETDTETSSRVRFMGNKKKTKKASKKSLLLSNVIPLVDRVVTGARFNGAELIAHWNSVRPKVDAHRAGFDDLGFTTTWENEMDALASAIESAAEHKDALADDALPTGEALNDVIAQAKAWRRTATARVRLSPTLAARAPNVSTGSSPVALAQSIGKLLPLVAHAAAVPNGAPVKAEGAKLLKSLVVETKKHKAAAGKISPAVRGRNAEQGTFYEELKRVARAARVVAPEEAELFAPSHHVHVRSRSRDRKAKAGAASSQPSTTNSPATATST